MKRLLICLALAAAVSMPALAAEEAPLDLKKGMVLVQDFGENVGLDELYEAFEDIGIKVNRVRGVGNSRYRVTRASYKGKRYTLTVDRKTGEIDWVSRYGTSISVVD